MAEEDWPHSDCNLCEWESPDYEPGLPVSEKSNPLTRNIDQASAYDIVRLLEACDHQMFQKESGTTYQGLFSDSVVRTMTEVANRVELILRRPADSLIVLSGCGTSGRLAFFLTNSFNRALKDLGERPLFSYIIAGGDRALLTSQEAPEDDPELGRLTLEKFCEGKRHVLFIGISCGLSAPFVAGQLDLCMQHPDVYTPVLVGFNPVSQARNEPMTGLSLTFKDVVEKMQLLQRSQQAFIINPVVGPEAISGSSRMKGGSATKILLETVLSAAFTAAYTHTPNTQRGVVECMRAYGGTVATTYSHKEQIAAMVEAAGQSLLCGRRVCYLGWGSLAVVGLIDASECIPTFGADYDDIRAFASGGYQEMRNREGPLTSLGPHFCIAHKDFLDQVLPTLCDLDMVLLICSHMDDTSAVEEMAHRVRQKTSNLHVLYHGTEGSTAPDHLNQFCQSVLNINWPANATGSSLRMWELSTKLVLNAVSTGAHTLKGKVYKNYMIDVQVTNSKLYHRAKHLLQTLCGVPEPQSEEALLKAIYGTDDLPHGLCSAPVTTHTVASSTRSRVVPQALVCLLIGCSLPEAESLLKRHPVEYHRIFSDHRESGHFFNNPITVLGHLAATDQWVE